MLYMHILKLLVLCICAYLAFPSEAQAYLDPGTGSYLFQILIASLIGAAFAAKLFWKNIVEGLKKLFNRRKGA